MTRSILDSQSEVISLTRREHGELIGLIDELVEAIVKLPDDVQWGVTSVLQDAEILDFILVQTLSLRNAKETALYGFYRDAYHLLRMVLESYLILRLVSTCDKYPQRIRVQRSKFDRNLEEAKQKAIGQVEEHFQDRLVGTYWESGSTLVAVLRGIPVVDVTGAYTGEVVPFYYDVWKSFRPLEYHLKREEKQRKLPTLRFLTRPWADSSRRSRSDGKSLSLLYRYFFTFDSMLENLRLNRVLDNKTSTRVAVHYNFLSSYSHSSSLAMGSIMALLKRHQVEHHEESSTYDHYHSELVLLYVCHLLSMHLHHALYYLASWRSIPVRNERRLYRSLCGKVEDDFGYFWFIFNRPHEYDRYCHANRKSSLKKRKIYRPEDIRLGDVRYYDDPLHRLSRMHQSQLESTTGNEYNSPFPRDDVLFQR